MTIVETYLDSALTDAQLEAITRLLLHIWPAEGNTFDEILKFVFDRRERLKGTEEESIRFVLWEGTEALAHARMFGRVIHTQAGALRVGALSSVCVHEIHRGKGYGADVVKAALALVDRGVYPVSLWQTEVAGFYEKLGARVITNPFVNSKNPEKPDENPWYVEAKMIYPANYPWPEGVIDLNGNAY
jgi:GNAT superfamily N-acetyltransferase